MKIYFFVDKGKGIEKEFYNSFEEIKKEAKVGGYEDNDILETEVKVLRRLRQGEWTEVKDKPKSK